MNLRVLLHLHWKFFRVLILLVIAGCGGEATFPSQPIILVCPWSAGGGTDRVARQLATQLEGELGVPVNVVNATGGGGVTGHTKGALARPNGYTMTLVTAELNMLHWRGLTSITHEDYAPLMLVNRDDAALFVKKDAPWATLKELEDAIRANPAGLKASGTAYGGIWHISLAGWLTAVGLQPKDATWISINGATPSLQELMAGGIDLVCCSLPEARSLLDAGEIRCLGLMSEQRLPAFPDVPTLKELGVDWSMGTWRGLMVPPGVPPERAARLLEAVKNVANSETYLKFMAGEGFNPAAEAPEAFKEFLAVNDAKFGTFLTSDAFKGVKAGPVGAYAFPTVLGILLALNLAAVTVLQKLKRSEEAEHVSRDGLIRMGLVAGWIIAYMVLAEWAGFVLTATVLLFFLLWQFRVRWYVAAVIAVVLVGAAYQLFAVYLRVPLPLGFWGA